MLQSKDPGKGTSSSRKQREVENKIFFRLPSSYLSFFQSMAENYYQRGKIKAPTIGLLAKTCLITVGNAWNRMQIQLMNRDFDKKRSQQEAWNPVNKLTTERGYPTSESMLDTNNRAWRRTQQHQSQPELKDEFYYNEDYGALQ